MMSESEYSQPSLRLKQVTAIRNMLSFRSQGVDAETTGESISRMEPEWKVIGGGNSCHAQLSWVGLLPHLLSTPLPSLKFRQVLVYDSLCQDVIAPLLTVQELRDLGVTLHLLINSEREPIPGKEWYNYEETSGKLISKERDNEEIGKGVEREDLGPCRREGGNGGKSKKRG